MTGGAGFLGSHVVDRLRARGYSQIFVPGSREYDLTDLDAVRELRASRKIPKEVRLPDARSIDGEKYLSWKCLRWKL